MHYVKSVLCFIFIFLSMSFSAPSELQKATGYLEQRGEVYFSFYVNSRLDANALTDVVSIDRVEGTKVFAYANKDEFEAFRKTGIYYEVQIPPGLLGPKPVMSDYSDPDNRQYDKYPTYEGYVTMMNAFATKYPDKVKITKFGSSINGRDLLAAKVSDNVTVKESEPEWFMVGPNHGDETLGIMLCLRLIDFLCTSYDRDDRAHRIIDSMELYLCPIPNPDGTYKGGNSTVQGAIRANANGKDLNRNYPKIPGGGTSETQETETKAFVAFIGQHHFVGNMDWHAGVETAIYPYSGVAQRTADDAWYRYVNRIYADLAQKNGPAGYYQSCDNGICNGYADLGYVAQGTTKDYYYYYKHTRGMSNEVSATKLLPESQLNNYWNYNKDAILAYLQVCMNGFRGNVTDSLTGKGLPAKVFVESYDKDSSWLYADSLHGNYYRPILAGTYNVTFSYKNYKAKTISGVKVETGKGTIVNVKLWDGTTEIAQNIPAKGLVKIIPHGKDLLLDCGFSENRREVFIYDIAGTLVKTVSLGKGFGRVSWDGTQDNHQRAGRGCYVVRIRETGKSYFQSVILAD